MYDANLVGYINGTTAIIYFGLAGFFTWGRCWATLTTFGFFTGAASGIVAYL